jgi:TonB family protein
MAHSPISRPDSPGAAERNAASSSFANDASRDLAEALSLTDLAATLSAHGGGSLSADLALDIVLNDIVEQARLATNASAAAIALVQGEEIICRATTGENAPGLGVRLDAHSGLSGACVQSKECQRCDDTETDSRVDPSICNELGVRSILVYPVLKNGELIGVAEIFSSRPNAFSDREIQTLEALSRDIVNNLETASEVPSLATDAPSALADSNDEPLFSIPEPESEPVLVAESVPLADFLERTIGPDKSSANHSTTVLMLSIVLLAVVLGWLIGYGGRRKDGTQIKTAAATQAAQSSPRPVTSPSSSSTPVSAQSAAPVPKKTASPDSSAPSEKDHSQATAASDLVVYDKGKVVYREQPKSATSPANPSAAAGAVMPASSVADLPTQMSSQLASQYLTYRVEPEYPEQARDQHIQGPVVLDLVVSKSGTVEKLDVVSGNALLADAASDAVRQWRFKPFSRNGRREEFQTQVTVSFRMP